MDVPFGVDAPRDPLALASPRARPTVVAFRLIAARALACVALCVALCAALCVALGAALVAPAVAAPAHAHTAFAGRTMRAIGSRAAAGDTLLAAGDIERRCGGKAGAAQRSCFMAQLLALRDSSGTRVAMGALNRLANIDRNVETEGHDYAHMIGIASFKATRDVSGAFMSCTEILQSGCYHGVIQTYLASAPSVGSAEINAVCRAWTAATADRWLRFQCAHGMGHGLTMFYAHDLPRALEACDLLGDLWDRKSCYGGAFMENLVFATDPRMAAMVMEGLHGGSPRGGTAGGTAGGMAGMDMSEHEHGAPATAFKMIDRADPSYPCSVLAERYQEDCWLMQPAVILDMNGRDFAATFRACDRAPDAWRAACYTGTGTAISGYTLRNQGKSIAACALGTTRYQPWCFRGVAKNFIDVSAVAGDGISFCKAVPGRPNQLECYVAVGEEIGVLRNTAEARRAMCDTVAADDAGRDACLFGARVLADRPAGLPVARN